MGMNDREQEEKLAKALAARVGTEGAEKKDRGPGEMCRACPYKDRRNLLKLLGET
jgi:hypothetical protein